MKMELILVFIIMKKREEELEVEVYKSETSDEYETVTTNKLFELVKSNKVTYEVYKRCWYVIGIILFIIIVSMT